MSTTQSKEAVPPSPTVSKGKKSKKKKNAAKAKANGDDMTTNGAKDDPEDTLATEDIDAAQQDHGEETHDRDNPNAHGQASSNKEFNGKRDSIAEEEVNTIPVDQSSAYNQSSGESSTQDTEGRLEALAQEREALRDEVATLRRSLELYQAQEEKGDGSSANALRQELEEARKEKEQSETNYQNLLGRVNTLKQTLGERLKSDAEELSQTRTRIEELEEQNANLRTENVSREEEVARLAEESGERSKELSSLRNRLNLSQQNWLKEREELRQREDYVKEEADSAKQAMQEWEILAMEERSIKENLEDKVGELEEQVTSHREAHERLEDERQTQARTVDGLQKALQEIQGERKKELREMVENFQSQVNELRKSLEVAEAKKTESIASYEEAQAELKRVQPFEVEVKEKNLLIGKLRHEAVILNDHLTKALRQLKKGKPEDTIDRQLVTNYLLHFLSIERSDPRKFQVLQVIASLLNWSDEQQEQAGLSRPGASNVNLRTPISPWHRTPSTPSLSSATFGEPGRRQESLGGLFSEFLEKESEDGRRASPSTSTSGSARP